MTKETQEAIGRIGGSIAVFVMWGCWNAVIVKFLGSIVLNTHITWGMAFKAGFTIGLLWNIWSFLAAIED